MITRGIRKRLKEGNRIMLKALLRRSLELTSHTLVRGSHIGVYSIRNIDHIQYHNTILTHCIDILPY